MKAINKILLTIPFLTAAAGCNAQIKNAKTETVKIHGNCEMCEKTIEEAAYKKGVAEVDWNKDTKMAVITYNSEKQTSDEILKRIAYAGYDNEKYLAPDEAYAALPGCCQYERKAKKDTKNNEAVAHNGHHQAHDQNTTQEQPAQKTNQLKGVFDAYFELKNALVKSDSKTAAAKATQLKDAVDKADMGKMENEQHNAWMKVYKSIGETSADIAKTSDIATQRRKFSKLSENMIQLAGSADLGTPVYQQHCPMYNDGEGADWLSTENAVKNPYYGSQMLTCGKTVKTIK